MSIQLSIAAAALGVLAGVGLGKGEQPKPIDAELAANKVVTIHGSNIADGTVKFQDLNKASIEKHIYFKAQVDKRFVKLSQADELIHKVITNDLAGYIKLRDADTRYLKVEALNGYLKLTDADARFLKLDGLNGYLKLTDADARFLKLDGLNGYLKLTDADARFLKLDALDSYLKLDAADARYLKTSALDGYIKLDALDGYLKLDAADGRYLKLDAADGVIEDIVAKKLGPYVTTADADARYVKGDGSVLTGSQLVGDGAKTLLTVPKALEVSASNQGGVAKLTLHNLTSGVLEYDATARDPNGGPQGGTIDNGASVAILIGLLQPATVQVVPKDGSSVHTFSFSAFDEGGGQLRVVGQALSGAPPAAG